jgi:MoaA/NifB/PqqE/SkfB family radical SAM enzyme
MSNDPPAERVKEMLAKQDKGPSHLEIYPTRACNLHCLYCDVPSRPRVREMTPEKLKSIVKEGCEHGAHNIRLVGDGEPFIRKDVTLSLMEFAKQYPIYGTAITNGTLLNNEDLTRLVRMGWDELIFSLDTHDEETQDELRGATGAFRRVVAALRNIKAIKEAHGKKNPAILLSTVISRLNFRQLKGLAELAHELGIDQICFDSLVVYREWMKSLALDDEDKAEFMPIGHWVQENLKLGNIKSNIHFFLDSEALSRTTLQSAKRVDTPCLRPWYSMVVTPDGGVKPCCAYPDEIDSVRERSLMEVWRGRAFKGLRKSVLSGEGLPCYSFCSAHMQERNRQLGEMSLGKP